MTAANTPESPEVEYPMIINVYPKDYGLGVEQIAELFRESDRAYVSAEYLKQLATDQGNGKWLIIVQANTPLAGLLSAKSAEN